MYFKNVLKDGFIDPFEYRTKFSPLYRPQFDYRDSKSNIQIPAIVEPGESQPKHLVSTGHEG